MRILQLIKHCDLCNGHVNVAVDLACLHARDGHAVAVGSAGGDYEPFFRQNGIVPITRGGGGAARPSRSRVRSRPWSGYAAGSGPTSSTPT